MRYDVIIGAALKAYEKKTKQNLITHPLATQLQARDSPEEMLTILQRQASQLRPSGTAGDEKLKTWLGPVVNVLYSFSATLGEGAGLVTINSFVGHLNLISTGQGISPTKAFFAGVGILLLVSDPG